MKGEWLDLESHPESGPLCNNAVVQFSYCLTKRDIYHSTVLGTEVILMAACCRIRKPEVQ